MARTPLPILYAHAARAAVVGSAGDRTNFALQIAGMVVNNGFMLVLWFMFFAGFRRVGGWGLSDMGLLAGLLMTKGGVAGIALGGTPAMAATPPRRAPSPPPTHPPPALATPRSPH